MVVAFIKRHDFCNEQHYLFELICWTSWKLFIIHWLKFGYWSMLSHSDCPDESASTIFGWMTMWEILYFYAQKQSLELTQCFLFFVNFCKISFMNVLVQWTLKNVNEFRFLFGFGGVFVWLVACFVCLCWVILLVLTTQLKKKKKKKDSWILNHINIRK